MPSILETIPLLRDRCASCGEPLPRKTPSIPDHPGQTISTEYAMLRPNGPEADATDESGSSLWPRACYPCAAKREAAEMVLTGRATLYLAGGGMVTDYTGNLRFKVVRSNRTKSPVPGCVPVYRETVWFRDHLGAWWVGVQQGNSNMICRARRLKEAPEWASKNVDDEHPANSLANLFG